MKRTSIVIPLAFVVLIAAASYIYYQRYVKADVITVQKDFTVVSGTILSDTGKPMANVLVSIGGVGVKTFANGKYEIVTMATGGLPVRFQKDDKWYQTVDGSSQDIVIDKKGQTTRKDFTIKPIN